MRALEQAGGVHGDVRVSLSTGVPHVVAVGIRRGDFGKDFAADHGTGLAVVVELEGAVFERLVVTSDDAVARGRGLCTRHWVGPAAAPVRRTCRMCRMCRTSA